MSKLTKPEARQARAAFVAVYPGADPSLSMDRMKVDEFIAQVCRTVPLKAFLGLRFAVLMIALSPLFVIGRFSTFAGLSAEDRERVMHRLYSSRTYLVRQLVMIIKSIGALLYAADPQVRARIMAPRSKTPLVTLRPKSSQAAA